MNHRTAVIAILVSLFHAASGQALEGDMKRCRFPADVGFQSISSNNEAEGLFTPPKHLRVSVKQPVVRDSAIIITEAELLNEGDEFVLVVNPYGGAFPYGGTNPFRIFFASPDVPKYSGRLYPPSPPLPLAITVPARSSIVFEATIDLDNYTWEGTPEVVLYWAFYYLKAPYPEGELKIQLPKKIYRKPEGPPIVNR